MDWPGEKLIKSNLGRSTLGVIRFEHLLLAGQAPVAKVPQFKNFKSK